MVDCEVIQGVASKSLLKVRLRCKFGDAEERAAFRYTSRNSALHPHPRKSNCSLQNAVAEKGAEKLHGGLRCEKRGWHLKVC